MKAPLTCQVNGDCNRPDGKTAPNRRRPKSSRPRRLVEGELILDGGLNAKLFELLDNIDRIGSINRAAGATGLTYKGAWEMIERANNLSPRALLEKAAGGRAGGGTRLTETGKTLVAAFFRLQEEKEHFLDKLNDELGHDPIILQWFRRLLMKSSARNQWLGKVLSVHHGAVTAEVTVSLRGGATLIASLTDESAKTMGLVNGKEVIALVKAPMIMVVTDLEGYRLSARNQLSGTITHLRPGLVHTEVIIELPGGDTVVATITTESCDSLGLKTGSPATAVFKASAVMLGVAE